MSQAQSDRVAVDPWRSRIVGEGEADPQALADSPANFRLHPSAQQLTMGHMLGEVGWVQRVVVNQTTGHLIDGHLRVYLAKQRGEPSVPVVYVALSLAEEQLVLTTLDPLAAMAEIDQPRLQALVAQVATENPALSAFLGRLRQQPPGKVLAEVAAPVEVDTTLQALELKGTFPSDLPWGIPPLLEERLSPIPQPLETWAGFDQATAAPEMWWLYNWGTDTVLKRLPGPKLVQAFYCDDDRFERFWNQPARYTSAVVAAGVSRIISPNFSMWFHMPRAVQLYQTYRARWMGRFFQEAGLGLIPDLNWSDVASLEYAMIGLPVGAPALAIQLQTMAGTDAMAQACEGLSHALTVLQPESLLVYGSGDADRVMARVNPDCRVVRVLNRMGRRRGRTSGSVPSSAPAGDEDRSHR